MRQTFSLLVSAAVLFCAGSGAFAASQSWDISDAGGIQSGNGVWSTLEINWSSGGTRSVWTNGNDAVFASGAYSYGVSNVTANSITIQHGSDGNVFTNYAGGGLTLGAGGISIQGNATFNCDVNLSANQTWTMWGQFGQKTMTVGGLVSGVGQLIKGSAGPLTLTNTANNFSGGFLINNGSVTAQSGGTVLGAGPVTLGTVVPTAGLGYASVATVATLTLNNGAVNATNTIGNVTNSGAAMLTINSTAGTTNTLSAANLVRVVPGTLVITPQNGLGVRELIKFSGGVNPTAAGILEPWMVTSAGGGDFLTNTVNGLTNVIYAGGFNAGLDGKVVKATSATALSSGQAYYAAKLGANLNLSGNTLTLGDGSLGGLILDNAAITNGGEVAFGAAEALIYVGSSGTIAANLTGTGKLTKFGAGTLVLSNANLWAGGSVNLNGGTLTLAPTADATIGPINGVGNLTKDGLNTVTLTGTNNISSVARRGNSGNGLLTVNRGTLTVGGSGASCVLTAGVVTVGQSGVGLSALNVTNASLSAVNLLLGTTSSSNTISVFTNAILDMGGGYITVGGTGVTSNRLIISSGIVTNLLNDPSAAPTRALGIAGNTNGVTILNGGKLYIGGQLQVGGVGNSLWLDGTNSILSVGAEIQLGTTVSTIGMNSIQVSGGGRLNTAAGIHNAIGVGTGASSNSVTVSGPGSIWNNAGSGGSLVVGDGVGSSFNSITISNGGLFVSTVTLRVGDANFNGSGSNNAYNVGGLGASSTATNGAIVIGGRNNAAGGGFNTLTVTNARLVSTGTTIGDRTTNNTATVTAGGYWTLQGNALTVGSGGGVGNVATVQAGGILEAGTLATGAGAGNLITNNGGVYQFNTATPTITTNGNAGGSIFINNGAISFRGITTADVKGNWSGTGLTNMTFSGANAFRLNNATNNTTSQTYWFDSGAGFGATNYAGLEMVNGGTAYTNGSVTIGTNGWLMCSNTTAILWGAVTNYGRLAFYNSTVTFSNSLVLNGGTLVWTTNSTVNVKGALTLPASMIFSNVQTLVPGTTVPLALNASGGLSGSPSAWTVYPNTHRVVSNGTLLSLVPRLPGFLFIVE